MARTILPPEKIHPDAATVIQENHRAVLESAAQAIETHEWVVLGMGQNPVVKKARALLHERGLQVHYLAHGNYLKEWRKRNVWKMWTGWPTFPMVFHNGTLIGGAKELASYLSTL